MDDDVAGNGLSTAPAGGGGPLVLVTIAMFVCFALLVIIWPVPAGGAAKIWPEQLGMEGRLMLIVLISGAFGACIHAARAFAYFHGVGRFDDRWRAWYFLRIPTGMGLALLFYFVVRAGLFSGAFADASDGAANVNPFGFAALAGLTGMFAKQATAKLEELFDNLFMLKDSERPPPVITSLTGTPKVGAADNDLVIKVTGSGFEESSKALLNGLERVTDVSGADALTFTLLPSDVAAAGTLAVRVQTGERASRTKQLQIVP